MDDPGAVDAHLQVLAGWLPGPGGVAVGHAHRIGDGWLTGCTVVLPPVGTVGGVAVAGGGPGTRETDALDPATLVPEVDAVLLTGGSAFGLVAADGVMTWCEGAGRGFAVRLGDPLDPQRPEVRVPIVPAAVVFDLGRGGSMRARPDAGFGYAAAAAAGALLPGVSAPVPTGRVGAGAGARVAAGTRPGGVGVAAEPVGDWQVGAVVVANSAGTPVDSTAPGAWTGSTGSPPATTALRNTTLAIVVTDATLDVARATRLARAAHAGIARAVDPSHTLVDGDVVFALATCAAPTPATPQEFVRLEAAAAHAVTAAFAVALLPGRDRGPQ